MPATASRSRDTSAGWGVGARTSRVGILRLAPLIGPQLTATVGHYVTAPLVPTIVGRNARLQLLHVEDALAALEKATIGHASGTYNIAGDGVVMMSQANPPGRQGGSSHAARSVPQRRERVGGVVHEAVHRRATRVFPVRLRTRHHLAMRSELGFEPRWTTMQALDDFMRAMQTRRIIKSEWIDRAENALTTILGGDTAAAATSADVMHMPLSGRSAVKG